MVRLLDFATTHGTISIRSALQSEAGDPGGALRGAGRAGDPRLCHQRPSDSFGAEGLERGSEGFLTGG